MSEYIIGKGYAVTKSRQFETSVEKAERNYIKSMAALGDEMSRDVLQALEREGTARYCTNCYQHSFMHYAWAEDNPDTCLHCDNYIPLEGSMHDNRFELDYLWVDERVDDLNKILNSLANEGVQYNLVEYAESPVYHYNPRKFHMLQRRIANDNGTYSVNPDNQGLFLGHDWAEVNTITANYYRLLMLAGIVSKEGTIIEEE